jgi:glycosyltransferase involved in cell wall biosynthesis
VPRPWSSATEAVELADGDIGITWLPNDSWSQGKCGLRVLQFMAAGLPVVANPVGMNRKQVADGETGFLATTPDQWAEAIVRLATDPQLRERMGQAGRWLAEDQYSVAGWQQVFSDIVTGVAPPALTQPERRPIAVSRPEAAANLDDVEAELLPLRGVS